MRVVSVFSMIVLAISIWALFFTVFFIGSDDIANGEQIHTEQQDDQIVEDNPEQENNKKTQQDTQENIEESVDTDESADEIEDTTAIEKVVKSDPKPQFTPHPTAMPTSLFERASSPHNDILYEFEKDNPISVDYLLYLINLN